MCQPRLTLVEVQKRGAWVARPIQPEAIGCQPGDPTLSAPYRRMLRILSKTFDLVRMP